MSGSEAISKSARKRTGSEPWAVLATDTTVIRKFPVYGSFANKPSPVSK